MVYTFYQRKQNKTKIFKSEKKTIDNQNTLEKHFNKRLVADW